MAKHPIKFHHTGAPHQTEPNAWTWRVSSFNTNTSGLMAGHGMTYKRITQHSVTYDYAPDAGTRDASIYKDSRGKFWLVHTNVTGFADPTSTFTFAVSEDDGLTYTRIGRVDCSAVTGGAGVGRVWAPEWYVNGTSIYVIFSRSVNYNNGVDGGLWQPAYIECTSLEANTWGTATVITGTALPTNIIDHAIVKKGSTYYLWCKNENTSFIECFSSSSVFSGYDTAVYTGNALSWGSGWEATQVFQDGSDWVVMAEVYPNGGYHYSTSSDDWVTWGPMQTQPISWNGGSLPLRHGTFVKALTTISAVTAENPVLISSTPPDNGTLATDASLTLTFSDNIFFNYPGGGTLSIKIVGGATVETFTPTSTTAATGDAGGTASISGAVLTINPFADLVDTTQYAVRIASDCLEDSFAYAYAGIANDTTLSFTAAAGAANNAETNTWEDAVVVAGGTVSAPRLAIVDTFISALKTAGIWTKMDRVWLFAAENSASALTDLVGTNAATVVNSPTFTADEGYTTNGSTSYVNTGLAPSGASDFTLNSGHLSAYNRTSRAGALSCLVGSTNSYNATDIYPRLTNDTTLAEVNANDGTTYASTSSAGHWIASRTDANTKSHYKNGSLLGTTTSSPAGSRSAYPFWVGGQNLNDTTLVYPSSDQVAAITIGAGLNSTEAAALASAVNAYMTSLGKNVY
jgi:hypothetical protein